MALCQERRKEILGLIGYYILKTLTISVGISNFRKIRNKIDMNLLGFFCDINFSCHNS